MSRFAGHSDCLLLLDLDHFKAVNDRHGHRGGDQLLREVARVLETVVVRRTDLVARYGGEEFAVVLDDADEQDGERVAERIRKAIGELRVPFEGQELRVTASVGVAVILEDGEDPSTWLEAADQALYQAKSDGRDRVVLSRRGPGAKVG